jgi:hypothetical protein
MKFIDFCVITVISLCLVVLLRFAYVIGLTVYKILF